MSSRERNSSLRGNFFHPSRTHSLAQPNVYSFTIRFRSCAMVKWFSTLSCRYIVGWLWLIFSLIIKRKLNSIFIARCLEKRNRRVDENGFKFCKLTTMTTIIMLEFWHASTPPDTRRRIHNSHSLNLHFWNSILSRNFPHYTSVERDFAANVPPTHSRCVAALKINSDYNKNWKIVQHARLAMHLKSAAARTVQQASSNIENVRHRSRQLDANK